MIDVDSVVAMPGTEKNIGNTGLVFPGKDGKSEFNNMQKAW